MGWVVGLVWSRGAQAMNEPSVCGVCEHPMRILIERDLHKFRATGRSLISTVYGVSHDDLELHWHHLDEALAETREAVLARVQRTERLAEGLYEMAAKPDDEGRVDVKSAAAALRELRGSQALLIAMLPKQEQDSNQDYVFTLKAEIAHNPAVARGLLTLIANVLPKNEILQLTSEGPIDNVGVSDAEAK